MSFPTDPNLYIFSPPPLECQRCFDPNKTPSTIFLQLTGILTGDDWVAGDPAPPNDLFELTLIENCSWELIVGDLTFSYLVNVDNSFLSVLSTVFGFLFLGVQAGLSCLEPLFNFFTVPTGNKFYSGSSMLTSPLDSGAHNNIELMALLNIEPEIRTFANPQAISENVSSTRYSQRNGRTNIYIKYDFT